MERDRKIDKRDFQGGSETKIQRDKNKHRKIERGGGREIETGTETYKGHTREILLKGMAQYG